MNYIEARCRRQTARTTIDIAEGKLLSNENEEPSGAGDALIFFRRDGFDLDACAARKRRHLHR